ncbi:hypothetical protein ABID96_000480 [Bacillus sp. OAE603]
MFAKKDVTHLLEYHPFFILSTVKEQSYDENNC